MKYGVCCGAEKVEFFQDFGYDFFEWSVGSLLKPLESEQAFMDALKQLNGLKLKCEVVNCFVPGKLKITGNSVDFYALNKYVKTVMQRAKIAGIEKIVFGSGGAREIPEGFSHSKAIEQLKEFTKMAGGYALENDVVITLEPLNVTESNVFNTVQESADFVRELNHPAVRLLADAYHMMKDNDSFESIVRNSDIIEHIHVATVPNRKEPGVEKCCFPEFFEALKKAGYDGRVSIEGKIENYGSPMLAALQYMKKYE